MSEHNLIGNFELIKRIGKGNFAEVKLARESLTKLKVAIKIIDLNKLEFEQINKLWREIEILKKLQRHHNVLRLYQVIVQHNHVYLVTEFCQKGELFEQVSCVGCECECECVNMNMNVNVNANIECVVLIEYV